MYAHNTGRSSVKNTVSGHRWSSVDERGLFDAATIIFVGIIVMLVYPGLYFLATIFIGAMISIFFPTIGIMVGVVAIGYSVWLFVKHELAEKAFRRLRYDHEEFLKRVTNPPAYLDWAGIGLGGWVEVLTSLTSCI